MAILVKGDEEHFCEITLKSGHWQWRRCLLKVFFSIFSSGRHFVQPSGAILEFWLRAISGILLCKYFEVRSLAKDEMSFEDFLFFSSGGHLVQWNRHCGHLGFSIGTILACFDPEVIMLLQSKFPLKAI